MNEFLNRLDADRNFFELAYKYAPIGMALVSPDRRFLRANPAMCTLMGRTQEELLKLTVQDVSHPEDRSVGQEGFRQMLAGEVESYEFEKRYLQPDGKVVWAKLSVTAAKKADGEVDFLIGQAVDVSSRREAEAALSQFFNVSINLMALVGVDGYLKRVNQAWCSVLGYGEEELLAVPYMNFIHPGDHQIVHKALEAIDRDRQAQDVQIRMLHKAGHYRMMSWNSVFPVGADAFYSVSKDVTTLHEAMETLAATNLRLQETLSELDALRGIIPICSSCKRIRSDDHYMHTLETFISQHSGATFSHGLCPECLTTARELMHQYVGRKPQITPTGSHFHSLGEAKMQADASDDVAQDGKPHRKGSQESSRTMRRAAR